MEIQTSTCATGPTIQEVEKYWDIDRAAAFLGYGWADLWVFAELGLVPAHKLHHGNQYCWKFKPSELHEFQCDDVNESGAAIQ